VRHVALFVVVVVSYGKRYPVIRIGSVASRIIILTPFLRSSRIIILTPFLRGAVVAELASGGDGVRLVLLAANVEPLFAEDVGYQGGVKSIDESGGF